MNSRVLHRILSIDTSAPVLHAAVLGEGGGFTEISRDVSGSHSGELTEAMESLLRQAEVPLEELEAVVVGSGPGSFTGLRIGFGFAKGLALGLDIPLVRHSSLEAWAFEHRAPGHLIISLAAGGGPNSAVAAMYWCGEGSRLETVRDAAIVTEVSFGESIEEEIERRRIPTLKVLFTGPAFVTIRSGPREGILPFISDLTHKFPPPRSSSRVARSLIELFILQGAVARSNDARERIAALSLISPDYVIPVAAKTIEERREAAGKGGS